VTAHVPLSTTVVLAVVFCTSSAIPKRVELLRSPLASLG